MNIKTMIKQIKIRQDAVAKERDKIADMISEMNDLEDCCNRAYHNMQDAIDALSELV